MKIEEQVCSLELAQKLKALGAKQESAFWWEQVKVAGKNEWSKEWQWAFNNYSKPYSDVHIVSAFTVAELGEMLPLTIQFTTIREPERLHITTLDGLSFDADTEADTRAKMLIYLIENNLVNV